MRHYLLCVFLVLSAKCEVACQTEGYDTGAYERGKCLCSDFYDLDAILGKKTKKALPGPFSEGWGGLDEAPITEY